MAVVADAAAVAAAHGVVAEAALVVEVEVEHARVVVAGIVAAAVVVADARRRRGLRRCRGPRAAAARGRIFLAAAVVVHGRILQAAVQAAQDRVAAELGPAVVVADKSIGRRAIGNHSAICRRPIGPAAAFRAPVRAVRAVARVRISPAAPVVRGPEVVLRDPAEVGLRRDS